jgi:hypothetical protein
LKLYLELPNKFLSKKEILGIIFIFKTLEYDSKILTGHSPKVDNNSSGIFNKNNNVNKNDKELNEEIPQVKLWSKGVIK